MLVSQCVCRLVVNLVVSTESPWHTGLRRPHWRKLWARMAGVWQWWVSWSRAAVRERREWAATAAWHRSCAGSAAQDYAGGTAMPADERDWLANRATKLSLTGVFLALMAAFSARLSGRQETLEIRPFDLLLLGLSTYGPGRLVAFERVTAPRGALHRDQTRRFWCRARSSSLAGAARGGCSASLCPVRSASGAGSPPAWCTGCTSPRAPPGCTWRSWARRGGRAAELLGRGAGLAGAGRAQGRRHVSGARAWTSRCRG